jgi:hypothetical protein
MKNLLLLLTLSFTSACGMFGGGDDGGGNTGGGYPDPARVCTQITPENKEQITAEYGRSCKVGDWLSKGAPSCSSSQEKCMMKKY